MLELYCHLDSTSGNRGPLQTPIVQLVNMAIQTRLGRAYMVVSIILIVWFTLYCRRRDHLHLQHKGSHPAPRSQDEGFAYIFYATNDAYACSVLVNIFELRRLRSAYAIHVLVSSGVGQQSISALLASNVTVHEQEVPPIATGIDYYRDCLLKLLAFKMHTLSPGLRRVLIVDADQLILRNLDDLFYSLPTVDLAAPRAYWISNDCISSTFLLISLSDRLWDAVESALNTIAPDTYDMDLINDMFGDTVMMLSGEYATVNSHWEDWNLPRWYHPVRNGIKTEGNSETAADSITLHSSRDELDFQLCRLREAAAVIHFFAVGKPWSIRPEDVNRMRPHAHHDLRELFESWHAVANSICPHWSSRISPA